LMHNWQDDNVWIRFVTEVFFVCLLFFLFFFLLDNLLKVCFFTVNVPCVLK